MASLAKVVGRLMDRGLGAIQASSGAVYEGASQARRMLGWRAPSASPNTATIPYLSTLRSRSRNAVRNDGYAKSAIDKLVSNIIGTGIKPLSQAKDADFRRSVQALWLRWTDESDADGLLDWYGQQAQAVRAWLEGGEVFVRLRPRLPGDGLSVPLQIQVLEPEMCPHDYNVPVTTSGSRVRAGIEFDAIGRRVAYYFYASRPGEFEDIDTSQLRRVPASSVIHLFDPLRPGQLRGVPHLAQALVTLNELDKYDDATLLRQQLSNLFVAFLTRQAGPGDDTMHPLTGQAPTMDGEQASLTLEPGIFQELAAGEDVKFSTPPGVGPDYADFVRQNLYSIAAATGVPYEVLTGDMRNVNDRVVRVILNEFRRRIQALQHQIVAFQLCRPVWRAWFDRVFLSGALFMPMEYLNDAQPWSRVKWMPHGWPYLHPVQDVTAQREAVRCGFTTRSAVVSECGEDAEEIDAEQKSDNDRADTLGLPYASDPRATLNTAKGAVA